MTTSEIRSVYQCTLKLITAIHVGSGDKHRQGLDYVCQGEKIHILNTDRMFSAVEKLGTDKINTFTDAIEADKVSQWLGDNGIQPGGIASHSFSWRSQRPPMTIHAHIRDGMSNPIIPGSSLKGALRTAIIRKLAKGERRAVLDKAVAELADSAKKGPARADKADTELLKKILGNEPNTNLLRLLTVGDFSFSRSDLGLQPVLVSCLESPTGKRLIPKKNKGGNLMPPIAVEKLTGNAVGGGMISFDDYLAAAGNTGGKYLANADAIDLPWLLDACCQLSRHTIETELDFFKEKTGGPAEEFRTFYTELIRELNTLDKNRETIVQMAWGSGWRGMTGQLLEAEQLSPEVRKKLKLAPAPGYLDFPFPKSRKSARPEDNHNDSALPMGWVKINFKPMKEVRKEAEEKEQLVRIENEKRHQAAAVKGAMNVRWQAMDELERDLACVRQETIAIEFAPADAIDPFLHIWKRFCEYPIGPKRELAMAFKERWQREDRWVVKNKKGKQFEKVAQVKVILQES